MEIAGKINIRISEQNLKTTGVNAKSGLCRIKGEPVFIMDKRLILSEKILLIGNTLNQFPLDDIYIVPAVRNFLNSFEKPNPSHTVTTVE
ncbi:MAG: hypothetical protein GXP53_05810 [Deltaproteobacteria bacterium]|nr:hypothetical protein [Deltaproteobacteria bacterium]